MFSTYRNDIETALRGIDDRSLLDVVASLTYARHKNSAVYILGNGGSAATSSHFANDLVKACGIRAYSLPDMVPAVTAFGNDHEWEEMYWQLLKRLLLPSDVVVGISCSGNSPNIVTALHFVKQYQLPGLKTIGLIGANLECSIARVEPDVLVSVPFRDIRVQEDCHMIICHAIVGELANAATKTPGVL